MNFSPRVRAGLQAGLQALQGSYRLQRARIAAKLAPRPTLVRTVASPTPPSSAIYHHQPHPHTLRNVNDVHRAEQAVAGFNVALAVWLTKHTGTMVCAYLFAGIGIGSLIGVFTGSTFLAAVFGSLSSYFLQLVFLPVLQVGSNVLNRHVELQADEMFATTQKTFQDAVQIMEHLSAQDQKILALEEINRRQVELLIAQGAQIAILCSQAAQPAPASPATPAAPASSPTD